MIMDSADTIFDASQLCLNGDFDTQVANILYHVRLTASEVKELRCLFDDLEYALQTLARGIKVMPFGSIVTGLGIKTSDVDCYVELPNGMTPPHNIVNHAKKILRKHYNKFTQLFAITNAKVPIVKFLHIPTNCHCDVNFKSPAGVYNSQLISHLLRLDGSDKALYLAVIIKYWSKIHKITGTNLLASYALTLMVLFYLQLMGVLPSIYDMQNNVPPLIIDGWNLEFDRYLTISTVNAESLYDLIGGFFKCYNNFNFEENVISPYMGRLLRRDMFKSLNNVPAEYQLYKQNVASNYCKPLRIDTPVCVQDPFEHCRNASATVYAKLAVKLKYHFQYAARMFDELQPNQFLIAILTKDPNVIMNVNDRNKPKPVFHNKVMKHKNPQQRHGLQNSVNLIRCYQQIRRMKVKRN